MSSSSTSTSPQSVVEECKKIIFKYLFNCIPRENVISLILYGSIARNEERYKYSSGKLLLASDIDLLIVVKNSTIRRSAILLRGLSDKITRELNEKQLSLSHLSWGITTEKRLLNSTFYATIGGYGKVIFGKDLVSLMPDYRPILFDQKSNSRLLGAIFYIMISSLESFVYVDLTKGKKTPDNEDRYYYLLLGIEKLAINLIRTVLVKENVYSNPWGPLDLNDLKVKVNTLKYSKVLDNLLKLYEDVVIAKSPRKEKNLSIEDVKKYWTDIIDQFNLTVGILLSSDTEDAPHQHTILTSKLLSGDNTVTRKTWLKRFIFSTYFQFNLLKFAAIHRAIGRNYVYLPLYQLFLSSRSLLESVTIGENKQSNYQTEFRLRKSRLELIAKYLSIWRFTSCILTGSPVYTI